MRKVLWSCMISLWSLTFFGCAEIQTVLGNNGDSISSIQNYKGVLAPDFQLLGKIEGTPAADWALKITQLGGTFETESIVYGHIGDNKILEKGLIVRTYKVRGIGATALPDLIEKSKYVLDSGTVKIAKGEFAYASLLTDSALFKQNEKKMIDDRGFILSDCYLVKEYDGDVAGVFNKSRSHLIYFERIDAGKLQVDCRHLARTNIPQKEERLLISEVSDKADRCIAKLLGGMTGEKITAVEPTGEKAPVVEGSTELERKLSTLKKLLDKGYIAQDDYDQKKSELLKNF